MNTMKRLALSAAMMVLASGTMAESIPIPDVQDHNEYRTIFDMQDVCQRIADSQERPCTVVQTDDRVCYAPMNMDGSSETVQCYLEGNDSQVAGQPPIKIMEKPSIWNRIGNKLKRKPKQSLKS